jgi:hypothetical protein
MPYGEFGIGLYMDSACLNEYQGDLTVQMVVDSMQQYYNGTNVILQVQGGGGGNDNKVWTLAQELKQWNSAFEVYKQCQPCKAYDLTNIVAGKGYQANQNGNRNGQAYNGNYNNNGGGNGNGNYNKNNGGGNGNGNYYSNHGNNRGNRDRRNLQQNNGNGYYINQNYNAQAANNNNNNNSNENDGQNDKGDDEYEEAFHCNDDAGYDNVNQVRGRVLQMCTIPSFVFSLHRWYCIVHCQ